MRKMTDEHAGDAKVPAEKDVPLPSAHRPRRVMRTVFITLCCCCLLAFIGLCLFIDSYGHQDHAQPAAAIVILGAGMVANNQPGDSLRARTQQAVVLYQRKFAGKIICTGGVGKFPPAEAQVTARLATQLGVPAGDLILEDQSTNTEENTRNSAVICRKHGWTRVVAVSDPYHLWRVKRDFAAVGITAYTSPALNCRRDKRWALRVAWTIRDALAVARDMAKSGITTQ